MKKVLILSRVSLRIFKTLLSGSMKCLALRQRLLKIGINCFLTYKISYANMMGQILYNSGCGNEIDSILSSIGDDSRIGSKYLRYGLALYLFAPRQPVQQGTMLIELVYSIVSLRSRMTSMIHMQSLSVTIVSNRTLTISHILSRALFFKKGSMIWL